MILHNRDKIDCKLPNLVLSFAGKRQVFSTGCLNGGYQSELSAVLIHCDKDPETGECDMKGNTYEEHLSLAAKEAGFLPQEVNILSTAAPVEYAQIEQETFRDYCVTAVVTGGILFNGRRIGDLATMWEQDGVYHVLPEEEITEHQSGTINILVHIDAKLSTQAMAKALMLATEAKVAAIQEIGLKSCYGDGIATGSGTDGVTIIADDTSPIYLTQAGSDTKLGQCIGRAVKRAVKQELLLQMEYEKEQNRLYREHHL